METDQEFKDPTKMSFSFHFGNLSRLPDHHSLLRSFGCTYYVLFFIESHNAEIMLMLKTFNLFILCNIHPELFFYKSRFWRGRTST